MKYISKTFNYFIWQDHMVFNYFIWQDHLVFKCLISQDIWFSSILYDKITCPGKVWAAATLDQPPGRPGNSCQIYLHNVRAWQAFIRICICICVCICICTLSGLCICKVWPYAMLAKSIFIIWVLIRVFQNAQKSKFHGDRLPKLSILVFMIV